MEEIFKTEIISPEKVIFSSEVKMVTLPSFEGDMSILKNHISIITFLRPGILRITKKDESLDEFFLEDGTVEFFDNNLVILSSSAISLKELSKEYLNLLLQETQKKLENKDLSDHDKYIFSHKINVIKEIRV